MAQGPPAMDDPVPAASLAMYQPATFMVLATDDAVTALSGSGPAYVFYWVEAMVAAAVEMGLTAEQGKRLALATFDGATALAAQSDEPVGTLRERVTSKGGTTFAALESMRTAGVAESVIRAVQAAQQRAAELGDEFGR